MKSTAWRVYMNGVDLHIVESNYAYAVLYWHKRGVATGRRFSLIPV